MPRQIGNGPVKLKNDWMTKTNINILSDAKHIIKTFFYVQLPVI